MRAGWAAAAAPLVAPLVADPLRATGTALRGRQPSGLRKAAYSTAGILSGFAAGLTWPLHGEGTRLRFAAHR